VNRLAGEHSPYLLQHADNPVDWFPWGDEAFEKARTENKPIFLSIGYSTCHWCHVMAHESFENADVAAVLNASFVPIKLDREERPDVDRVYMTFVQATTGSGGWPMSVWLTPDLKPFYGGTYFPPTSRWGRPGFVDILGEIARVWQAEPAKVQASAESLTTQLRSVERVGATFEIPGAESLDKIAADFRNTFDHVNGGLGQAPKFPRPSELLFLLRHWALKSDSNDSRDMALVTLRAMALGGMRDHIGGGFHRYSVDEQWRVPHFEKMLYDQAQLVMALLEASQASGDPFYADVAEDTLQYVMREMTDEAGGFYSAEDADSIPPEHANEPHPHATEGAFYLWTADEVDTLVGADSAIVKARFGIEPTGNAPADPQQEFIGKNLLYTAQSIEQIARATGKSPDEIQAVLRTARLKMFDVRGGRPRPHLDDKVLTAWNGLMIAAFARASRVVKNVENGAPYLEAAVRAATFLHDRMWDEGTSTLLRRYRRGEASIDGYAEDHAYLIYGLLELFQAGADVRWLDWAEQLQRRQDALFWDEVDGGWFSTTGRDKTVLLRMKEDYDGAEPTASSVSVMNLLTLTHLVHEPEWEARIEKTLRHFGTRLQQIGRAVPLMAAALATSIAGIRQVVIVGEEAGRAGQGLRETLRQRYLPFTISLNLDRADHSALAKKLPFIAGMHAVDGKAAAYVCRDFTCQAPVTDRAALEKELV
jgi:hypothetical protein